MTRYARIAQVAVLAVGLAGALSFARGAASGDHGFVVIVNRANPLTSLKRNKVAAIFMGQISSRWPFGAEIVPVNLPPKSPARVTFFKQILKMGQDEWKAYWIDQKLTRNLDPPQRAADPAEAKRIVASKPGAIAYIPTDALDNTVKVLAIE